jgi:hypothetical protein
VARIAALRPDHSNSVKTLDRVGELQQNIREDFSVRKIAELSSMDTQFGIKEVEWQRFDPEARVRLLPGPDQLPGRANVDDNANGIVDDTSELGATHSDDVCVIEASVDPPSDVQPSIVLQRGAYIPVTLDELFQAEIHPSRANGRHSSASDPQMLPRENHQQVESSRAIVFGHTGDDAWSFLIDLPTTRPRTTSLQ